MNSLALRLLPVCLSLLIAGCDEARPLLPANATLPAPPSSASIKPLPFLSKKR